MEESIDDWINFARRIKIPTEPLEGYEIVEGLNPFFFVRCKVCGWIIPSNEQIMHLGWHEN